MKKMYKTTIVSVLAIIIAIMSMISVSAEASTLEAGSVDGYIGSIVSVPFTLNATENVAAMDIVITYDATKLEYVSSETKTAKDSIIQINKSEDGTIKGAMINADGVQGKEEIFALKFEVLSDASNTVSVDVTTSGCVNANLKTVTVNGVGGKIKINGRVGINSTVVDNNNTTIGSVDKDGKMVDNNGNEIGIAATEGVKSNITASTAAVESNLESKVAAQSGVAIESTTTSDDTAVQYSDAANATSETTTTPTTTNSTPTTKEGFKLQSWMIYAGLGIVFVIVVILVIVLAKKGKKDKPEVEEEKYENVFDDVDDQPTENTEATEDTDNTDNE